MLTIFLILRFIFIDSQEANCFGSDAHEFESSKTQIDKICRRISTQVIVEVRRPVL